MTDTTNGWPGKPGVPLNPEKDEFHWLRTPDGELVPYNWRPEGECEWGRWVSKWIYDKEYDWNPKDCTYLGPCLTPDEATALQARVAELDGALATAARVLHKAGEQFAFYANQHATKGTAEGDQKAAANQQWAQRCFSAHDAALEGEKA